MQEKPFKKVNKLAKSATWVNVVGTVGFIVLAFVGDAALHNTALLIVFLLLALLCAAIAFYLMLGAARRNKAAVDEIVREAKAEQQRRING
jgi:multisubunit Na+/H+ antiporter MnhG subunit